MFKGEKAGLKQFNHAWRQALVLVLSSWWSPDREKSKGRWIGRKELNQVLEEWCLACHIVLGESGAVHKDV